MRARNVTVSSTMLGYCNVTIPKEMLGGLYVCLLNGSRVTVVETSNSTHASLHFTYTHDGHVEIAATTVIPEFPTAIATLLLLAILSLTLLFTCIQKKGKRGGYLQPSGGSNPAASELSFTRSLWFLPSAFPLSFWVQ